MNQREAKQGKDNSLNSPSDATRFSVSPYSFPCVSMRQSKVAGLVSDRKDGFGCETNRLRGTVVAPFFVARQARLEKDLVVGKGWDIYDTGGKFVVTERRVKMCR